MFACLLLSAAGAMAQTTVSGSIGSNTRWTVPASPYLVNGDLNVQNGAVLTIDPGVTVYMAAGSSITVQSGGIQAVGTLSNPIRVLSDKTRQGQAAAPGDWSQWTFNPGTSNTRLDHLNVENGSGLVIHGAAPELNFLSIRNHRGAAMTIDLAASPFGVGNQASGCTLNGISVPVGDVTGTVRWGLRGIPYLVTSGVVSVGASPTVGAISPSTIEQGATSTVSLTGSRLLGLDTANFNTPGLAAQVLPGATATQAWLSVTAQATAAAGAAALTLRTDAGEFNVPNAITVLAPQPTISALDPTVVFVGQGATAFTVTGRNFTTASEVLFNAGAVPTTFVSATQLRATLPNQTSTATLQAQVRIPDASRPGQYLLSNAIALSVQAPIPPTISVEPTPIALPPDGLPHQITIRLSKADYRDNTLAFTISDTAKATVSPATAVIPAGQTTTSVTIIPKLTGTATFSVDSATLTRIGVPLFIAADFRGANTAYATPVGVVVQTNAASDTTPVTVTTQSIVGVSVGAVLTRVSPTAWAVGTAPQLVVQGAGIPAGAQVSLVPASGVTAGAVAVSADGSQLSATLTTASDAPVGPRHLVIRDSGGKDIVFADPSLSVVQVMSGVPTTQSIEPIFGVRGTTLKVLVRGTYLQQGLVRVLPATGLRVDTAPVVSADGSSMTFMLEIAADAPLGIKAVQVITPAGATESTPLATNTFSVVTAVNNAVTPVASPLVGVLVGADTTPPQSIPGTAASTVVGVVVGSAITDVAPRVGVVGTQVLVTVRGVGLQGVSAAAIAPSTGVTVTTPSVNADGTELTFLVTVDAGAATGARGLVISASATGAIRFVDQSNALFLISAPVPVLTAVAPQVLVAGQSATSMTVRGRNLNNVSAVRIEPPQSITVTGPFTTSSDGSQLTFTVNVGTGAVTGARAVVVTTPAGESTSAVEAGNMVRIANQVGPTYASLPSSLVGVIVGAADPVPDLPSFTTTSPVVGVMIGAPPPPDSVSTTTASAAVGIVVGSAARSITPAGWLQGATGTIVVGGQALDTVSAVSVVPPTSVLMGAPISTNAGAQLSISITVAPDAALGNRQLRLTTATGNVVSFVDAAAATFGIGKLPSLTSASPILFEQGKVVTLVVRGTNLQGVTRVFFEPANGLTVTGNATWSQDTLGELLTVSVAVDSTAPLGARVLRLEVPGGATPANATPANTINVVVPQ